MTQLPKPYREEWGQHKDYGKMLQAPLAGNNGAESLPLPDSGVCQDARYSSRFPKEDYKMGASWVISCL